MADQGDCRRFLKWITFLPSLEHVARALSLDFLSDHHPSEVIIYHLDSKDSLVCVGSFGSESRVTGIPIAGIEWRNQTEATTLALTSDFENPISWSEENRKAVINLYSQGIFIGFIAIIFLAYVKDLEKFAEDTADLSSILSLYMTFKYGEGDDDLDSRLERSDSAREKKTSSEELLTSRQRNILTHLANKRTNNQIARELGYSVSTIRHETIKIFEVLGVSDRAEASNHATRMGII